MARLDWLRDQLSELLATLAHPDWRRRRARAADPELLERLRELRLVAFDLDGTLTASANSWARITSRYPGQLRAAARHYRRWSRGRISRQRLCDEVVRTWQPPPTRAELETWLGEVALASGAAALLRTLHERGVATAIISSGIDLLARRVASELGIETVFANALVFDAQGALRPRVVLRVTPRGKATILRDLAATLGVSRDQTMYVGDGKEDVSAVRWAGLGTFLERPNRRLGQADLIISSLSELDRLLRALPPPTAPSPETIPDDAAARRRLTSGFGPSFIREYGHYSDWKRQVLSAQDLRGRRILDLGCADGTFRPAEVRANEVHGVDLAGPALSAAAAKGYEPHALDLGGDPLPFESGFFDVAVAFDILEHVADPYGLLQELVRVVRPGGELFISVPNSFNIINRAAALLGRSLDITDRHHQLSLPFSDHLHRIELASFRGVLEDLGLDVRRTESFAPGPVRHRGWKRLSALVRASERLELSARMPTLFGFAFLFVCVRPPEA